MHGFDAKQFLATTWQQHPLLLPGAFPQFENPISADELAGLALEAEVESRLIIYQRQTDQYLLENGPFDETRFAQLPQRDWTLLVQAVDQWSPDVAQLIEPFRHFLPDWRIDDVMVSYATQGGGVGPHYDHYDVFLVQGSGRRRWRIGPKADAQTILKSGSALRQMRDFPVSAEYLLEPGDILYVPPGWGHWGEAEDDDCMTYSVGFRAPDQAELIAHWAEQVLSECSPFDRYTDPPLAPGNAPYWLTETAVEHARQLMLERLQDKAAFNRWLGQWLSEPKYPEQLLPAEHTLRPEQLQHYLATGGRLERNPGSRWLLQQTANGYQLCVDGACFPLSASALPLAEYCCRLPRHGELVFSDSLSSESLNSESAELLTALCNAGSLWLDETAD